MKKVLITGAGGTVGSLLIKYLLTEGKYEITALDLRTKNSIHTLKKYRKRVDIIYADILDRNVIESIVKDSDIVINLATCMPNFSEYKKDLAHIIEYNGTENIIKAINFYNPKCTLIYGSSTSLNGHYEDYYSIAKNKTEKLISKKVKNYVIVRFPLILSDLRKDYFIYSIKEDNIEAITKEDAAYSIVKILDNLKSLSKKTINISGGDTCRCTKKELFNSILKYHGLSFKYIFSKLFGIKVYSSPYIENNDKINHLLDYQNDSLQDYFRRQSSRSKLRKVSRFFGKIILFMKGKSK